MIQFKPRGFRSGSVLWIMIYRHVHQAVGLEDGEVLPKKPEDGALEGGDGDPRRFTATPHGGYRSTGSPPR